MSHDQKEFEQCIADKETEMKNEPNKKDAVTPSEFEVNQNNFSSLDSDVNPPENNKEELKFFGVSEYYINQISQELISKYGNYFLKSFDKKNLDVPPPDFMSKHEINPLIRTKMVNWMLEVLNSFNSNEETIFCAVKLMDKYIWKTQDKLKSEDIHLIGLVCMYLASKTYDIVPIQMKSLIHTVGHDTFDKSIIIPVRDKEF